MGLVLAQLDGGNLTCRERGIRTPGTVTSTSDFESDPFDHSGSSLELGGAKILLFRHIHNPRLQIYLISHFATDRRGQLALSLNKTILIIRL